MNTLIYSKSHGIFGQLQRDEKHGRSNRNVSYVTSVTDIPSVKLLQHERKMYKLFLILHICSQQPRYDVISNLSLYHIRDMRYCNLTPHPQNPCLFGVTSVMPESHILHGARTMFKNSHFDQFRTNHTVQNWSKRLFLNIVRAP